MVAISNVPITLSSIRKGKLMENIVESLLEAIREYSHERGLLWDYEKPSDTARRLAGDSTGVVDFICKGHTEKHGWILTGVEAKNFGDYKLYDEVIDLKFKRKVKGLRYVIFVGSYNLAKISKLELEVYCRSVGTEPSFIQLSDDLEEDDSHRKIDKALRSIGRRLLTKLNHIYSNIFAELTLWDIMYSTSVLKYESELRKVSESEHAGITNTKSQCLQI